MIFTKQNKTIVSMPGVPYEMKAMFKYDFIPYILKKYTLPIIIHKHILTVGIGESQIADELVEFEKKLPSTIKLAYLPSIGKVKLRLTAKGTEVKLLQNQINEATAYILNKVKNNVYGFDDDILKPK
jgi:nicotinamide-nucleotide amidase